METARSAPLRRGSGRHARRDSGQAYAELVLVLPILVLLTIAVGDFGRVYATAVGVEDAAREAADYAAFDDVNASHFQPGPPVDATDATRAEAFRRACAAVSALPDFGAVAATCSDPSATCADTAGGFCQLQVEPISPWPDCTAAPDPTTCGWMVHVTITFEFHTALNFPLLPSTVPFIRESRYAISALPVGATPAPTA